jgi:hypothetical protein
MTRNIKCIPAWLTVDHAKLDDSFVLRTARPRLKSSSNNYDVLAFTTVDNTAESRKAFRRESEPRKLDVALLPPIDRVETSAERYVRAAGTCTMPKAEQVGQMAPQINVMLLVLFWVTCF